MQRRELIMGGVAFSVLAVTSRAVLAEPAGTAGGNGMALSPAQVRKIIDGLRLLGDSLPAAEAERLLALAAQPAGDSIAELERILDRYTLIRLRIDKHGIGRAAQGGAVPQLRELGWRTFLVRVENPDALKGPMKLISRSAIAEGDLQAGIHESRILGSDVAEIARSGIEVETDYDRDSVYWMGYRLGVGSGGGLEGAPLEYHLLQLYSQRGGSNTASLALGSAVLLTSAFRPSDAKGFTAKFDCIPASTIAIKVRDGGAVGAMASLLIRDEAGRLYPAPAHRLEPDLGYQPQIYRAHGETIRLPAGRYTVIASRGPEYLESERELVVAQDAAAELAIDLERWIDPPHLGWYSGDPHIHPEGQVYGVVSKYGVTPETMFRQVCGEALNVGSILIWTGGYYYEKQFFTGHVYQPGYALPFSEAQRENNTSLTPRSTPRDSESLIRYDVEQAAFPSNRMGHLVLLRLKNHDFPGARGVYDWPSWNLPILQWARAQGAVAGYAHIGHGMGVNTEDLPNYEIPALDDLGGNECLVDVTHGFVDFVTGGESDPVTDLNLWYHLLNCGFHIPMAGETDFSGTRSRVGSGRTYVKLDDRPVGDPGYSAWVEGLKAGRVYFGDGRSHFIDFRVNGRAAGEGALDLKRRQHVSVLARVAARLEATPFNVDEAPEIRRHNSFLYWHLERARVGSSRTVPLEVVVNGKVVERREVPADGQLRDFSFSVDVRDSIWIALRILPSGHTTPIVVSVAGRPVRASKRSAQWCLDCVDVLWNKHAKRIRESERAAAAAAWEHAREVYRRIRKECAVD